MGQRRILIATWGDPARWSLAEYFAGKGVSNRAFTSTEALYKAYRYDKAYVLGLDTLKYSSGGLNDYKELAAASREYIEQFTCGLEADIHIMPGVIHSNAKKIRAEGDPVDYYSLVLYTLGRELLRDPGNLPNEIHLDITHGINFMPVLTMKAVREIASFLSIARAAWGYSDPLVRLVVYNSDPLVGPENSCRRSPSNPCIANSSSCTPPRLMINKIFKMTPSSLDLFTSIEMILYSYKQRSTVLRPRVSRGDVRERSLPRLLSERGKYKGVIDTSLRLLKLFRYGLVPELLKLLSIHSGLINKLEKHLEDALKAWREGISIGELDGGMLHVVRKIAFGPGFQVMVYGLMLAAALEPLMEEPLTLEKAKHLKKIYDYTGAGFLAVIQDQELSKIKKNIEQRGLPDTCIKLADLLGFKPDKDIDKCQEFRRNIIAHGGWHTLITSICVRKASAAKNGKTEIMVDEENVCIKNGGREGKTIGLWEFVDKNL